MNIFKVLTEKSWLAESSDPELDGPVSSLPTPTFGLRLFFIVATVLFSVIIVAYTERMLFADWRPMPEPWVLWLNTGILVLSSVALQWARSAAHNGEIGDVRSGLLAGGALALVFLAGQLVAWQQLMALGYYASENPANGFFYMITTLHGLHLLGGLLVLGWATDKLWRGVELDKMRMTVELCAVYWHFLLVVWLVLFGLLLFT